MTVPICQSAAIDYFRRNPDVVTALRSVGRDASRKERGGAGSLAPLFESPELRELERCQREFNAFSALGVTTAEIRHSRVLGWLLDPQGSHGQGASYLKRFLTFCLEENGETLADIGDDISDARILLEDDHIDLLLVCERSQFVCAIENKIYAGQSPGQLSRYRKSLEREYPNWGRRFVFLTLGSEKAADDEWIPVSFAMALKRTLGSVGGGSRGGMPSLLIKDYVEWIREGGNPQSPLNLFRLLGFCRHELRHSDFLGWLLDPRESHGFGDAFLKYFLEQLLDRKGSDLPPGVMALDWRDTEVRREFEDVDLLLVNHVHDCVIVVENKLHAKERAGQLAGYRTLVADYFGKRHLTTVFLDLQNRRSSDSKAVHLGYDQLLGFFQKERCLSKSLEASQIPTVIAQEYLALLDRKLWVRQKTIDVPPPEQARLAEALWRKFPEAVDSLITAVAEWHKELGAELGRFLHQEARTLFKARCVPVHKVWYSFVPYEYDEMEELATSGADPAYGRRLLFYQFFMVPFGDQISLRPPQIAIDVKFCKASPTGRRIKQKLHEKALQRRELFNRVKGQVPAEKFDILLNYELCSTREIAMLSDQDLRRALQSRLRWFCAAKHQAMVAFFRRFCVEEIEVESKDI